MFFAPSLLAAARAGRECRIICLSTGNADGQGGRRVKELLASAKTLGIRSEHVAIYEHPELLDGMQNLWNPQVVESVVRAQLAIITHSQERGLYIDTDNFQVDTGVSNREDAVVGGSNRKPPLTRTRQRWKDRDDGTQLRDKHSEIIPASPLEVDILTFDSRGVSGHPNHIACHRGVARLNATTGKSNRPFTTCWQLHTEILILKYAGILGLLVRLVLFYCTFSFRSVFRQSSSTNASTVQLSPSRLFVASRADVRAAWAAMLGHESQLVWYRRLFFLFSTYSRMNLLTPFPV